MPIPPKTPHPKGGEAVVLGLSNSELQVRYSFQYTPPKSSFSRCTVGINQYDKNQKHTEKKMY